MLAVNTIEQQYQQLTVKKWIAVKTVSALKKVMMAKIAAKKMAQQKWIAAKMANAPGKDTTEKTAANMRKNININFLNRVI